MIRLRVSLSTVSKQRSYWTLRANGPFASTDLSTASAAASDSHIRDRFEMPNDALSDRAP